MATALEAATDGRPGFLRRAADGAWHVAAGFVFLLRRPRLWPLALLPVLLTGAFLVGGLILGVFALSRVDAALAPATGRVPEWLGLLITAGLWVATLTAGLFLGLVAALALAAPILDRLSKQVEAIVRGATTDAGASLRWELTQALRSVLYFLVAAPVVFLLGLIPLLGPPASLAWASHVLALQQTDGPLSRRGLTFRERRAWHKRWLPESLGFGAASLVALLVPFADLLLAPAIAVGATLLVLELEEGLVEERARRPADAPDAHVRLGAPEPAPPPAPEERDPSA